MHSKFFTHNRTPRTPRQGRRHLGRAALNSAAPELPRSTRQVPLRFPQEYATDPKGYARDGTFNDEPPIVELGRRMPLRPRGEVRDELGVDLGLGVLRAVVGFRNHDSTTEHVFDSFKLVYCFDAGPQRGGHAARHYIMDEPTLERLKVASTEEERARIMQDVLTLGEKADRPLKVGRQGWLPALGWETSKLDHDPDLAFQYETISKYQAEFSTDETGDLLIANVGRRGAMTVYYGPPTTAALHAPTGEQPLVPVGV
ncbi:MAG TPA: hypothetical protein VLE99_05225 [Candidatus Saccharimonadales bacterium]|nr:hypothetical protein [Candidatus Saccharimonadales bacterium]